MANLINRITQQIVEGVDANYFLAEIADAAHWVEHKVGEAVEAVEQLFAPELASDTPEVEQEAAAPVVTEEAATAAEIPAEAAAIAAAPEQAQ